MDPFALPMVAKSKGSRLAIHQVLIFFIVIILYPPDSKISEVRCFALVESAPGRDRPADYAASPGCSAGANPSWRLGFAAVLPII